MSVNANFAATPRVGLGQLTVANTNRDGSGTVVTIFTAGASGSRIDKITAKAAGTTTAGIIRFYIHDGTNYRLLTELAVTAIIPSGTVLAWVGSVLNAEGALVSDVLPLILPTGYSLRAAPHLAETFNIIAQGGDF